MMAYQLPHDLRDPIASLIEAIFPIEAWVATKPLPDPASLIPPLPSLPWREGPTKLSTRSMKVLRTFEMMFDDEIADEPLSRRWQMVKANPLAFFNPTSGTAAEWRTARGLKEPRFGPFEGKETNFPYRIPTPDGKDICPVSRDEYYRVCWDPLRSVVAGAAKPVNWEDLVKNLKGDACIEWPANAPDRLPVASSLFVKRLSIDILITCLGQRNVPLVPLGASWQRAVLIEAGENRHIGNEYGTGKTSQAVARLMAKIANLP